LPWAALKKKLQITNKHKKTKKRTDKRKHKQNKQKQSSPGQNKNLQL
jgi:hypothetical protein